MGLETFRVPRLPGGVGLTSHALRTEDGKTGRRAKRDRGGLSYFQGCRRASLASLFLPYRLDLSDTLNPSRGVCDWPRDRGEGEGVYP